MRSVSWGGARLRAPPLTSLGLRLKLAFARKFHNSNFPSPQRGTDKSEEPIRKEPGAAKADDVLFARCLCVDPHATSSASVMNAHLIQRRCASSID